MSKTGFVYDPIFLKHHAGEYHPETSERLESLVLYLQHTKMWHQLMHIPPVRANHRWIETIHDSAYIDYIESAYAHGITQLDPDTGIGKNSFEAAQMAVGAGLAAVDAVLSGRINNAFCAVRPPGHHAEANQAMGFCLFNNVAITARYIQIKHALDRVLILDWDAHHGNGTQHSFENDPSVFYISLHQYPQFPGSGSTHEQGSGEGSGTILNIPLPAGTDDATYLNKFESKILPAIDSFRPQFILISAGFDAHEADPICELNLSSNCFGRMTDMLMRSAQKHSAGRVVSMLEGGYNLEALARCVDSHIKYMMGGCDE